MLGSGDFAIVGCHMGPQGRCKGWLIEVALRNVPSITFSTLFKPILNLLVCNSPQKNRNMSSSQIATGNEEPAIVPFSPSL